MGIIYVTMEFLVAHEGPKFEIEISSIHYKQ